jgi:hypothetical protein
MLHSGQVLHHGDVQGLNKHQADMHTHYLTIDEDIEFPKVPSAKEMLEKGMEAKRIGRLRSLSQIHLGSNLENEFSIEFYNPCTTILLKCTS